MINFFRELFGWLFTSEIATLFNRKDSDKIVSPPLPSLNEIEAWYGVHLTDKVKGVQVVNDRYVNEYKGAIPKNIGRVQRLFVTELGEVFGFYRYEREWKLRIFYN